MNPSNGNPGPQYPRNRHPSSTANNASATGGSAPSNAVKSNPNVQQMYQAPYSPAYENHHTMNHQRSSRTEYRAKGSGSNTYRTEDVPASGGGNPLTGRGNPANGKNVDASNPNRRGGNHTVDVAAHPHEPKSYTKSSADGSQEYANTSNVWNSGSAPQGTHTGVSASFEGSTPTAMSQPPATSHTPRYPYHQTRGNRNYGRNMSSGYIPPPGAYIHRANEQHFMSPMQPAMSPNAMYSNGFGYTSVNYMQYNMEMGGGGMYNAPAPQHNYSTSKQQAPPVRRERKALDIINPATGAKIVDAQVVNAIANEPADPKKNVVDLPNPGKTDGDKTSDPKESAPVQTKEELAHEKKMKIQLSGDVENVSEKTKDNSCPPVIIQKESVALPCAEKLEKRQVTEGKSSVSSSSSSCQREVQALMFGTISVPEIVIPIKKDTETKEVEQKFPAGDLATKDKVKSVDASQCLKVDGQKQISQQKSSATDDVKIVEAESHAKKKAENVKATTQPKGVVVPKTSNIAEIEKDVIVPAKVVVPERKDVPETTDTPKVIEKQAAVPEKHITVTNTNAFVIANFVPARFRDQFSEIPSGPDTPEWPSMEIVQEGAGRSGRSSKGGNAAWDRGDKSSRQGGRGGTSSNGGSNWQRPHESKRGRGDRGNRGNNGGRGGPDLSHDLPLEPLERSENRWIPTKSTTKLDETRKNVQSIMNKMTREKFDRLAAKLASIDMESRETLEAVIQMIFDKALGEPHFCDMYADLCAYLAQRWLSWSFVRVVKKVDHDQFYWTVMPESDSDVVGPFTSIPEIFDSAVSENIQPISAPLNMKLHDACIYRHKFVKIWIVEEDAPSPSYFWSGEDVEDLNEAKSMFGPYPTTEEAAGSAEKLSFKRILVNSCREEFEKDNIYEELESKFHAAKKEDQVTPEMETEYAEKRMMMKRRMLGNIRFIGELFRKGLLKETIMHYCLCKLMSTEARNVSKTRTELVAVHPDQAPDEENIESLCKLLATIGKDLERRVGVETMDIYFRFLETNLAKDERLGSRIRFMLRDTIDLRRNRWEPRRQVLKTKTLTEIRKEAEREQRTGGSGTGGGGFPRSDPVRMENRRSAPNRENHSNRSTSFQQHHSSRGGLPKNAISLDRMRNANSTRDDSTRSGPLGRPAIFMATSKRGSVRKTQSNASNVPEVDNSRSSVNSEGSNEPCVAPANEGTSQSLTDEELAFIDKKSKSIAAEYISIFDVDEAEACFVEVQKELDGRENIAEEFASALLKSAVEAKQANQKLIFDLLEALVVTKRAIPAKAIRFAIRQLCRSACDLWCDVPKLHEVLASFMARFFDKLDLDEISIYWILSGCDQTLELATMENLIASGFLAKVCGLYFRGTKAMDVEKTSIVARSSKICYLAMFPPSRPRGPLLEKWIEDNGLVDILEPLQPAFKIVSMLSSSSTTEQVVDYIEHKLPITLRSDRFFAMHVCLLILESIPADRPPSVEIELLLTGFCADIDTEADVIAGIVQTHSNFDRVKLLLDHLLSDGTLHLAALQAWYDLEDDQSWNRMEAVNQLRDFVAQKVSRAKSSN
uniref:Eukaryotic translation initiation factor 4 gamma put n=1 Tax=Albugo laibachii Nc14 TaxID=890382 RepID=F0WN05_9STRA|nr:eukaryotic translation initiation factor 4 gamma put [Albugo laibachii Nc14]|eukprot:CCA22692.1 eukaryotic translation initiation factor 4 gamma put [Albugo laibachii Nc14]